MRFGSGRRRLVVGPRKFGRRRPRRRCRGNRNGGGSSGSSARCDREGGSEGDASRKEHGRRCTPNASRRPASGAGDATLIAPPRRTTGGSPARDATQARGLVRWSKQGGG